MQRHYEHTGTDSDGDTRITRRTETVAQNLSGPSFPVVRDGRAIVVDHGGRLVDGAEQVVDRFEQARDSGGGGFWRTVGDLVDGDRDGTLGLRYTRWVVRPGTRCTCWVRCTTAPARS